MMRSGALLVLCVGLVMFTRTVLANDPSLTTDFNLTDPSVTDFTFRGFRASNLKPPTAGTVTPNMVTFDRGLPALSGLGLSAVLFQFSPFSQVSPHTHPRAAELFYLLKGEVTVGFVDTANHLFEVNLVAGEIFVFPRNLVHFLRNNKETPALGYSALNSENPGVAQFAKALFTASGTGLPDSVLARTLGTTQRTVENIKKILGGSAGGY